MYPLAQVVCCLLIATWIGFTEIQRQRTVRVVFQILVFGAERIAVKFVLAEQILIIVQG
jgi:hypothetical protein